MRKEALSLRHDLSKEEVGGLPQLGGTFIGVLGFEYGFGYNKIPTYPIFYLLKGDYTFSGAPIISGL